VCPGASAELQPNSGLGTTSAPLGKSELMAIGSSVIIPLRELPFRTTKMDAQQSPSDVCFRSEEFRTPAGVRKSPRNEPAGRRAVHGDLKISPVLASAVAPARRRSVWPVRPDIRGGSTWEDGLWARDWAACPFAITRPSGMAATWNRTRSRRVTTAPRLSPERRAVRAAASSVQRSQ
jgi:hypothetical protein